MTEKIPTANPADGCPYCEYDKKTSKPCPDCGEKHDNERDFKRYLESAYPDAHPLDVKDNIGAYLAHKKQPDMVHNQHFSLLTGDKTRGRTKKPSSWGKLGKAVMVVSSPKTGETCNCETGDHANAGGQEHGMFNQDIGRQTWQGQGLPQPKQDKDSCQCDEKPAEANKVPNADARLGDDEDEKKKAYCQCNKISASDFKGQHGARPTGDFPPDEAADLDEGLAIHEGQVADSKVGTRHYAPPKKQSPMDKFVASHMKPEELQQYEGRTYDPDLAEKFKADDDEQITGTSTGAKTTKNPKKYLHKPSEHNPMGVINPAWTDWRAARRKQLKEGKRESNAKKLLENMSADTKLNLQTQAKLISAGTQNINDQKRAEQNKKRKKMTKQQLAARRKRLLGKAILKIKAMLERIKVDNWSDDEDEKVQQASGGDWNTNPNRDVIGAKDEADFKRRAQGLGGKGGCRGVGCDNKATKKLIGHVRDHLVGGGMSEREHKEIIRVCPDCFKKAKKWLKDQKRRGNTTKTERGDGTWGMRGLGEGEGTTDVQGSGDTHLISPVKQKELDRAMAGAKYYPRSVSRKKPEPDIYQ